MAVKIGVEERRTAAVALEVARNCENSEET